MQFTAAIFTALSLLGVAQASSKPDFEVVTRRNPSPLERRQVPCDTPEIDTSCQCDNCDEYETFKVGIPSQVPDNACNVITMPPARPGNVGGITGTTCKSFNQDAYHACCAIN